MRLSFNLGGLLGLDFAVNKLCNGWDLSITTQWILQSWTEATLSNVGATKTMETIGCLT